MPKRRPSTDMPSFWGIARSFLYDYLPKVRNLSYKTVAAYRMSLECFLEFLDETKDIQNERVDFECFERACIKEWLAWMNKAKNYAPKTIGLRFTAVKAFLRYCRSEDIALGGLYESICEIKPPRVPKKPIEYFEDSELEAILAACDGNTSKSRRNRALLIILYETAARISELADITLDDVYLTCPAKIVLHGKGGKVRSVPLGDKAKAHLAVYIDEFHPGKLEKESKRPLFYSMHMGKPTALSTDAIDTVLKKAAAIGRKQCPSIPGKVHCHLMRKTRAMGLYKSGVPLPLIMQLLGHESMSTTSAFYAFATIDMMERAILDATPAAMKKKTGWLTEEKLEMLYSLR